MYIMLLVGLLAGSIWLGMNSRRHRWLGWALAGVTATFFGGLSLWGEYLWFEALGYDSRFQTVVVARAGGAVTAGAAGILIVFALTRAVPSRRARIWAPVIGGVLCGIWGIAAWDLILQYIHRVPMGMAEPIFGRDAAFYLFALPLYMSVQRLLLALGAVSAVVAAVAIGLSIRRLTGAAETRGLSALWPVFAEDVDERRQRRARACAALQPPTVFLLVVLAWGFYLGRYQLMYSGFGVVHGPGWTDVHVRLPAYWLLAATCAALAVLIVLPTFRRRLDLRVGQSWPPPPFGAVLAALVPFAVVVTLAGASLWLAPSLSQWLKVQPTEIDLERPYLLDEIAFTRFGFGLHKVENRQFPASDVISTESIAGNEDLLEEVRLWDDRVLRDVYKQFQAIRLYYQFDHVDVDRYRIGDDYRLVMVSAREMMQSNLPVDNQTFVNTRFKFTHGNGITLSPVSEFSHDGLPNLLVHGIPPIAEVEELRIDRPEIYFGMLTTTPVFVNSREPEFTYPSGAENVYAHYAGTGGVALRTNWRKFVLGWRTGGTRLLLSKYPTPETRVQFRRQVLDRIRAIAPFLTLSHDPYIVVSEGRLYWLLEGYTTSAHFPYSKPYDASELIDYAVGEAPRTLKNRPVPAFAGANYVRNAVKVVVDAYNGSVDFYVFEPEDPIIRVWMRAFPTMFKAAEAMPSGLRAHVRYPHELLLLQGLVNARYHMEDPVVFYNQEDLWTRATERYYDQVQAVEPYYIMWTPPGAPAPEFVAMLPFTPKGRQVLVGWMAGLSDGDNYGRVISYQFPKDKRVLGPQQVDTKIDQDPVLKAQLTLWDQLGSRVIRGNVLAIPLESTVLYVEPIFIEADTAAYPELRVVVVMQGDKLSYADTFERALAGLIGPSAQPEAVATTGLDPSGGQSAALAHDANEAFDQYLRLQADGRFREAAAQLERLQQALRRLHPGFRPAEE